MTDATYPYPKWTSKAEESAKRNPLWNMWKGTSEAADKLRKDTCRLRSIEAGAKLCELCQQPCRESGELGACVSACQHFFHFEEIAQHLKKKPACPVCQAPFEFAAYFRSQDMNAMSSLAPRTHQIGPATSIDLC